MSFLLTAQPSLDPRVGGARGLKLTQRRDIPRLVRDGGAELSQLFQSEASQGWASGGAATGSKMPVCLGFSHSLLPSSSTHPSNTSHQLRST